MRSRESSCAVHSALRAYEDEREARAREGGRGGNARDARLGAPLAGHRLDAVGRRGEEEDDDDPGRGDGEHRVALGAAEVPAAPRRAAVRRRLVAPEPGALERRGRPRRAARAFGRAAVACPRAPGARLALDGAVLGERARTARLALRRVGRDRRLADVGQVSGARAVVQLVDARFRAHVNASRPDRPSVRRGVRARGLAQHRGSPIGVRQPLHLPPPVVRTAPGVRPVVRPLVAPIIETDPERRREGRATDPVHEEGRLRLVVHARQVPARARALLLRMRPLGGGRHVVARPAIRRRQGLVHSSEARPRRRDAPAGARVARERPVAPARETALASVPRKRARQRARQRRWQRARKRRWQRRWPCTWQRARQRAWSHLRIDSGDGKQQHRDEPHRAARHRSWQAAIRARWQPDCAHRPK